MTAADTTSPDLGALLERCGQTGRDLGAVDWSATPLGPPDSWPRSLATVVRVLLSSRFAMWMAWGPELTFLCNDAHRRDTLGRKYPWALGRPAREVWAEIWPEIGPRIETVLRTGEATWDEALLLILERGGFPEETYHTFSYSPLPDDGGAVAGILCVVSEESTRVIGRRRMATLADLGTVTSGVHEERDLLDAAADVLGRNQRSLPFTAVYLFDPEGRARLGATSGIEPGHPAAPAVIDRVADGPWPMAPLAPGEHTIVDLRVEAFGRLPCGAWEQPPEHALILPITQPARAEPCGVFVAGLNRFSPLDDGYVSFVELIVAQLAAGLTAARSHEFARRRAAQLEQTLQQLPAGVLLAEAPSGAIMLGNEQATAILGRSMLESEAARADIRSRLRTPDGEPLAPAQRPLARTSTGEVIEDQDLRYIGPTGGRLTLRNSAAPIRDQDGRIVAGVLVFQDVSGRVRSEGLLAAQRDILALVALGAPLERTLQAIALCLEDLSEYPARAGVQLLSADGGHIEHGAAPSMPASYNEAIDGLEIGPAAGSCGTAAFTGETVIVSDTSTDPRWSDYRELAAGYGVRAAWSTPIRADDGQLVGTLAVYYDQPREPSDEDRRVVDLLARTAGVAIGRARDARSRALRMAELQSSLLPRALPEPGGLRAAVVFHPEERGSDIGGDFYDLFSLGGDAWGLVLGDVRGHGAGAAAVTALTRHTTRAAARLAHPPAEVLSIVNDELRLSDHDRFCTALYGRLDPVHDGVELTIACGGHPPPLLRRLSGEVEVLRARGPLLGVFPDARFPEVRARLRPGDTLLFYTDGLVERNPRLPDDGGLRALLAALPAADVDELLAELELRALGTPPYALRDDVAALAVQVTGVPADAARGPADLVGAT